eukprot:TRINITY_DN10910_c0_g1_i1.p1 TRINITY_DN10910_c0_g1~~TRINITY_DN10910_c0_g1_i1.p1  ORF type:complete len:256 (+),score=69.70 TRINITY_DN10910_c0_g1_i1:42-809(+)
MRRSFVRFAKAGDSISGMKASDEDKVFALMEEYGDGLNYFTKKIHNQKELRNLRMASVQYDMMVEAKLEAKREFEDDLNTAQQKAVRSLPEVLQAAACRPSTSTWPTQFRKLSMTPPSADYTPPVVEGVELYEVPQDIVRSFHSGISKGEDVMNNESNINTDDSPIDIEEEEQMEEERMKLLRASYLWWRDQKQMGPRAETVHRDFMQMKHEQEIKLYTIRRAKHGKNTYFKKRQMMTAPVLRDDTTEGVMYRRK